MSFKAELSIPPHFFDSAKASNAFESMSEVMAKQFLKLILNLEDIQKGNPDLGEPDYISGEDGFEVTLAIRASLIPQLKGVKALDTQPRNTENELISVISEAVSRKADKNYSCIPSLVIITLDTLLTWYYPLYFGRTTDDPIEEMIWHAYTHKRDSFFEQLSKQFIDSGKFRNIYIIQPTHTREFVLFDVRAFNANSHSSIIRIATDKPLAFPTYKIVGVDNNKDPFLFETTVINYTQN